MSIIPPIRIGLGEDSHRIAAGRGMMIGGVSVDCGFHFVGHSDADVLLHAVTDAILGAIGLSDIGTLFPNSDSKNKDRSSGEMLQIAYQMVHEAGWRVGNLDCVVHSEVPKIQPIRGAICDSLAELLGLETQQVNVKGKTGESTGPVGRGELAEARCVALLVQQS
jgi:2-C-methyl-D-erythritol 2,4-cyclodiphosphate synthase